MWTPLDKQQCTKSWKIRLNCHGFVAGRCFLNTIAVVREIRIRFVRPRPHTFQISGSLKQRKKHISICDAFLCSLSLLVYLRHKFTDHLITRNENGTFCKRYEDASRPFLFPSKVRSEEPPMILNSFARTMHVYLQS